jgi:predicted ferric reductase
VSFVVIFLYVLVAFFQTLNLPALSEPINNLVNALPRYLGVAALGLFTWIAALAGRTVTTNVLSSTELDKKAGT